MLALLFILFPLAGYTCLFLFLYNQFSYDDLRKVALRAAILFTAYLVIILEVLSLFHAITRLGLLMGWSILLLAWIGWAYNKFRMGFGLRLPRFSLPSDWPSRIIMVVILAILIITFTVAWITPPQTWDSLTYHISRIAHWAQNRSLMHYPTGIPRQISMSPGAEMITLNGYVLTNSDHLAAFTEWGAMLGSLIGVSLIAAMLGAKPFGQWVAAGFAATIPMGIVQASSTITDYVAAFWLVCVAVESLDYYRTKQANSLFYLSLAAGLAILTKPNTVTYLAIFAIFVAVLVLIRSGLRKGILWAGLAILLVGVLNAGYMARNISMFGSLSNPADFAKETNRLITPAGVISNVLRNAAEHAGLPYLLSYDAALDQRIKDVHIKLGLDIQDPRTTGDGVFRVSPPTTQEDLSSNPYHAYVILLAFILAFLLWRKIGGLTVLYAVGVALAFILFSGLFKWHIFNVRYHMSFFVLFSPVIGVLVGSVKWRTLGLVLISGLFILSIPWLFSISQRPLIPIAGDTTLPSIITTPREKLYFSNAISLYDPINKMVSDVNSIHCSQVGLMLNGDDPEYLFWAAMGPLRDNLRIEWIVSSKYFNQLQEQNFTPCAIICKNCTDQVIRGLDLKYDTMGMQLYLAPTK